MGTREHDEQLREFREASAAIEAGRKPKCDYNALEGLTTDLMGEFTRAQADRRETEDRWLTDLRQYRGQYEPEEEELIKGSLYFNRITRTKVESVDARMADLLFPASRARNFDISATPEPSVPPEKWREIKHLLTVANGGKTPDRQTLRRAIKAFVTNAARKMAQRIEDQLIEARYKRIAREVIHSGNLYGTGVLKGPLVERRVRSAYVWSSAEGRWVYTSRYFRAPFVEAVPIWRFYPDMSTSDHRSCRYMWQHHRLTRANFAELAEQQTSFNGEAIKEHIRDNPDGYVRLMTYEQQLQTLSNDGSSVTIDIQRSGQYDVYERWGFLNGTQLAACGVEVPAERSHEAFFANVWMLPGGRIIKAVLQPIDGVTYPYHWYYYDKDETSVFGEGLAAIMRDDQKAVNAADRMTLDNAAITAGPQFEVNFQEIDPSVKLDDIRALKIWPRTRGTGQWPAVRELQFHSHVEELSAISAKFDANADQVTAIPKFTYGDNPQKGAAGTATGLSMLLGQSNIALKDQVANYDDVTETFMSGMYHWNMRYSRDDDIKGDFECKATGVSSLMAREVRAQALANHAATMQPEERQFVKWAVFARMRGEVSEIADVIMDDEEIKEVTEGETAKREAQMQEMLQQLQLSEAQARVANLQADAARKEALAALEKAKEMSAKVEAVYAAIQGAGAAAQHQGIAAGADTILRSVGWKDATPQDGAVGAVPTGSAPAGPSSQMRPPAPADANTGQRAGIETMRFE